jgi:hypothetical protein
MISTSLHSSIPVVMNRFDFDKVHRVMTFLDWKWATTQTGYAVPSVSELEAEAYRQLSYCVDEFEKRGRPASGMNISSGGFQANIVTFERGTPQLQLLFYVDEISHNGN